MELAIDTSTNKASLALSEQGKVIDEFKWLTNRNHTVELVPNIIEALAKNQLAITDISAIMIARGPGSFNGLRVGLATAKGLAFALGIPIVAISTLEAIACGKFKPRKPHLPVCAILKAGRGNIYSATFIFDGKDWQKLVAERQTTIPELCNNTKEKAVFCGDIEREEIAEYGKHFIAEAIIHADYPWITTSWAKYLAKLGWCRIETGEFDDPSTLQPLYLKKPSITKPKRRKNDAMSNMRAGI